MFETLVIVCIGLVVVMVVDSMVRESGHCPSCGHYCNKNTVFCPKGSAEDE